MKNGSIWTLGVKKEYCPSLEKDIETEILIIGGGMAGLSCAYFLMEDNKDIILIDKDSGGFGISAKSTAKITYMQGLVYDKIKNLHNSDWAYKYYLSQKQATNNILKIIKDNNIECNLEKVSSYVFDSEGGENKEIKLKKELDFYHKYGIKGKLEKGVTLGNIEGRTVLQGEDSYVFNPLKYMLSLKQIIINKGVKVFEKTSSRQLYKYREGYAVKTDSGRIVAKKVIVCTNYPFFISPGFTPFRTRVDKSYVVASKVKKNLGISAINCNKFVQSLRFHTDNNSNYMFYGGNSHSISNYEKDVKGEDKLTENYQKHFEEKIISQWSNQDVMTYDGVPYAGGISNSYNNLYVITGFNKWGMTNANITAEVVSQLINNRKSDYAEIFAWDRQIGWAGLVKIVSYNLVNVYSLVKSKLGLNKDKEGTARIEVRNGKKVGIYRDSKGVEHVVSNICPHMKCNLFFNYEDKTWDCPCHGSRFDIDGEVLMGPSSYSIKWDE